jgi:hypothetical protein
MRPRQFIRIAIIGVLGAALLGYLLVPPRVASPKEPEYPASARFENVQGTVQVAAQIGANGRVKTVQATGGNPELRSAAEMSVSQWVIESRLPFVGPPSVHLVTFEFRLRGKPSFVDTPALIVKNNLPDRIEIIARPLASDYPPLGQYHQSVTP